MIIRVYVDGDATPVAELPGSSGRLELDTTAIPDGVHRLRIETVEADRVTGQREIPFSVRNGPGIAVAGLSERDEVRGALGLVVDATAAGIDGELDVHSLELHRGLPFWTGALCVLVIILGALYLAVDPFAFRGYRAEELAIRGEAATPLARIATDQPAKIDPMQVSLAEGSYLPVLDLDAGRADTARGATTYRAKCAAVTAMTARDALPSPRRWASRASFRVSPANPRPISTASSGASPMAGGRAPRCRPWRTA